MTDDQTPMTKVMSSGPMKHRRAMCPAGGWTFEHYLGHWSLGFGHYDRRQREARPLPDPMLRDRPGGAHAQHSALGASTKRAPQPLELWGSKSRRYLLSQQSQYHRRLELNGRVRDGNGCFLKPIGSPTSRGPAFRSARGCIRWMVWNIRGVCALRTGSVPGVL